MNYTMRTKLLISIVAMLFICQCVFAQSNLRSTYSWLEGHRSLIIGNYSAHLYFDSDRQWVKYYIRSIYDNSYPRPEYEGKYTIDDGVGNFRGYKVIRFDDTFVLANPETGIVYDELKHPFSKKD